jgi:hypothetical protein
VSLHPATITGRTAILLHNVPFLFQQLHALREQHLIPVIVILSALVPLRIINERT